MKEDILSNLLSYTYNKYISHGVETLIIRRTNHTYTAKFKKRLLKNI